jgi:hypothetical protein
MPVPPKPITPDMLAQARRLYIETRVPVEDICALLGIGTYTFFKRRKEWGWPLRSKRIPVEAPPAEPEEDESAGDPLGPGDEPPPFEPLTRARTARLIAILQDATERELARLDRIAATIGETREDLGETQKMLQARASASRMLRELITIQQLGDADVDDDGFPRSDDELRRELSRKMDAILARRKN